jgi:hypothetical protein
MEGRRQRGLGSNAKDPQGGKRKTDLTLTGLLREGLCEEADLKNWESAI